MEQLELEAVVRNLDGRVARIEPLATKVDVREDGERTRRHIDGVVESLRGDIRLIAEGQVHLQQRFEELRTELKTDIAGLDRRLMRLEASR